MSQAGEVAAQWWPQLCARCERLASGSLCQWCQVPSSEATADPDLDLQGLLEALWTIHSLRRMSDTAARRYMNDASSFIQPGSYLLGSLAVRAPIPPPPPHPPPNAHCFTVGLPQDSVPPIPQLLN